MEKVKGRFLAEGMIDSGSLIPGTLLAGVSLKTQPRVVREWNLRLDGVVVSIPNADDFGSVQLCALPASNLIVVGAMIDLAAVVAGLTVNQVDAVDVALGTVATASVDFSNAGEDNLIEKIDGVGAAATGTIKGASGTHGALANVLLPAAAKNLFLNMSSPVAAGTGTVTVTGNVKLFVIDADQVS